MSDHGNGEPAAASSSAAVTVTAATKAFAGRPPVVALDAVTLEVTAGSLTVVLGESGSGKTTLLRAIAGFEQLDAGTIELSGRAVAGGRLHVPPERRRVGIVPQEGSLFPHLSVARNVAYGIPTAVRRAALRPQGRVDELLTMVGLAGLGERRPHQLSGGQQQRVAVARALAAEPAVVLLDEPFAALDASLRERLRRDVATALRSTGAAALLVTHDSNEAMAFADQLAVMRAGRIVQTGSTRDVYLRPVDAAAASALGPVVAIPGEVTERGVISPFGSFAADGLGDGDAEILLRPEQIAPATAPAGATAGALVTARVVAVEFQGHGVLVDLEVGGVAVRARWSADDEPHPGSTVEVRVIGVPLLVTNVSR